MAKIVFIFKSEIYIKYYGFSDIFEYLLKTSALFCLFKYIYGIPLFHKV